MPKSTIHLFYVPFVGLGLYKGYRGENWLANRIQVFKQFVIPSLLAQTDRDFKLWISWTWEMKQNEQVEELKRYLDTTGLKHFHTYSGVCFWDDKYPEPEARRRLAEAVKGASELIEQTSVPGVTEIDVLMTIQPSDDCYHKDFSAQIKKLFDSDLQAIGFRKGYICNYQTKELAEYNPLTIPPFFTIRFPRDIFIDSVKHLDYTGPYKSHEYIAQKLKWGEIQERGFLVGTHGENISTIFNHPFKGQVVSPEILKDFGLDKAETLKIKLSLQRKILRQLPHRVQRKLRYWLGEKLGVKL